jgi:hypothetical protein
MSYWKCLTDAEITELHGRMDYHWRPPPKEQGQILKVPVDVPLREDPMPSVRMLLMCGPTIFKTTEEELKKKWDSRHLETLPQLAKVCGLRFIRELIHHTIFTHLHAPIDDEMQKMLDQYRKDPEILALLEQINQL